MTKHLTAKIFEFLRVKLSRIMSSKFSWLVLFESIIYKYCIIKSVRLLGDFFLSLTNYLARLASRSTKSIG